MTRHKLVVDDDYEFISFGISCHLKDFRVAWHLNQLFGFNMMRSDIRVPDKEGFDHEYGMFRHRDEDNHLHYILLNNQSDGISLIRPYKQFNLLMLVEGYIDMFNSEQFIEKLQHDESFQLVMEVSSEPLKKFQFMLFED
ncbi:MAG: IPExxxVDY family protein [Flavobacteriales bacterium]